MVGISRALPVSASLTTGAPVRRRRNPAVAAGAVFVLVALNVGAFMLPIDYRVFGAWAYPGVFLLCFLANAAVAFPIPYLPIVAHVLATTDALPVVVAAAALGSVLGESVAFALGRTQKDLFIEHPLYRRLQRLVGRPVRAALVLFALAVPLNPLFDVAGIAAGALGLPYRAFFWPVLLGRVARFLIFAFLMSTFAL